MELFIILLGSYLIGSLPTSYIVGRMVKGIDIREHGSGNPGATNVFRVVGPAAGIVTMIIDAAKGFIPVIVAASLTGQRPGYMIAAGLGAVAGHMWTCFLNFRGGKGVATATGVFAAILPWPTLIALAVFAAVVYVTRYVSLGSILAALCLPVTAWIRKEPSAFTLFAAVICLAIIVRHRGNLGRLIRGTEKQIVKKRNEG